jgi:hypothetical protein
MKETSRKSHYNLTPAYVRLPGPEPARAGLFQKQELRWKSAPTFLWQGLTEPGSDGAIEKKEIA